MLPLILLGTMLILTLMRVVVPLEQKTQGKALKEVRLSLRERLLVQRYNIYAIGAVLLLGAIGGWMPTIVQVLVIVLTFAILMIPAKYILTSEGVALNNALFRRWEEFEGYRLQGLRVQLIGRGALSSFTLYVPSREQNELVKVLKRVLTSH